MNLLPFLLEAFGYNKAIHKDIDRLYESDKYRFYKAAKESEWYEHPIIKEGDIFLQEYARKALGILLCAAETPELMQKVFDIVRKGWPGAYLHVKNINQIDIESYLKKYMHPDMPVDRINTELVVLYWLASYFDKDFVENEFAQHFVEHLEHRLQHYNKNAKTRYNYETLQKEFKVGGLQLKKRIYENVGIIKNFDDITKFKSESIDFKNGYSYAFDDYTRELQFYAFLFDTEFLSMDTIFENVKFENKDIEEILSLYFMIYRNKSIENSLLFLMRGILVKSFMKAYKQLKDHYFENNKETMYLEMQRQDELIEGLRAENSVLKQTVDELTERLKNERREVENQYNREINALKKEISELQKQLAIEKKKEKELIALREFMFSLKADEEYIEEENNVDLSNIKGMIVGGHPRWQQKMKELLPNFSFLSADNENFDENIFDNIDVIFFFTDYLPHKLYYRVLSVIRNRSIQIKYLPPQRNIELVLQNIKMQLQ